MTGYAAITGWGKCVPPAVLTNDEIATVIDTSDEWIRTRSGIKQRHVSHVPGSDLAAFGAGLTRAAGLIRWGERTTALKQSDAELSPCNQTALEILDEGIQHTL